MTRERKVPDDRLVALVKAGRGTWQHASLTAAVTHSFGCHERYARARIYSARDRGLITSHGGWYDAPRRETGSGPAADLGEAEADAGLAYPAAAPGPSQRNQGSGRWFPLDRRELLRQLGEQPMRSGQVEVIMAEFCGSSTAAVRNTLNYAMGYGYLTRDADRRYHLTPLGRRQLERYGQLEGVDGVIFARFCAGKPGRVIGAASVMSDAK